MTLHDELDHVHDLGWAVATLGCFREGGWFCTLYPAALGREVWSNLYDGKVEDGYRIVSPRIHGKGKSPVEAISEALHNVLASDAYSLYCRLEQAIQENRNVHVANFLRVLRRTPDGEASREAGVDGSQADLPGGERGT